LPQLLSKDVFPDKMGKAKRATRGRTSASKESSARQASLPGSARPKEGEQGELAFLSRATDLGFALSLPYGHMQRYDFIVDSGKNIWRVQVKTSNHMLNGLYLVGIHHRAKRSAHAYTASEIDFVAAYILPEQTWYILPVREVTEHRSLLFRPKGYPRRDPYAHYREAWYLLREPDGLVFG
jgi:PD-(D/E)XK nuclease superfamily protein